MGREFSSVIEMLVVTHSEEITELEQTLRDCRDELAKQAEGVAALQSLQRELRDCQNNPVDGDTAAKAYKRCADELAALLREGL